MNRRPGSGLASIAIVLSVWTGVAALGADDAPKPATKPAEEAPKSAAEAPKSPKAVLSAQGLTRSGTSYILKDREDECFKKFEEIRPLYEKLETSYDKLAAVADSDAQINQLQAAQAMTQQELQMLSTPGNSMGGYGGGYGGYGGRYARYAQNPNAQARQQLQMQQRALSQQLAMAKRQGPTANQKQEAKGRYDKDRNALLESSTEVRELFEKVKQEYTDIEAEPTVRTALTALRKSAKAQLKIAPSAEFNKKLAQLKNLEKMMRPESASQAASAKVKSKRTAKSKR